MSKGGLVWQATALFMCQTPQAAHNTTAAACRSCHAKLRDKQRQQLGGEAVTVNAGCAAETHLSKLDQPCECDSWRPDLYPALQADPLQPDFEGQVTVSP